MVTSFTLASLAIFLVVVFSNPSLRRILKVASIIFSSVLSVSITMIILYVFLILKLDYIFFERWWVSAKTNF